MEGVSPPAPRLSARLRRLPRVVACGREVPVAAGLRARLLGLMWLDPAEAGAGLLIRRCSSVHTFGMRFVLDVAFLDREGRVLAWRRGVPPRRLVSFPRARAVLEVPAGHRGDFSPPLA